MNINTKMQNIPDSIAESEATLIGVLIEEPALIDEVRDHLNPKQFPSESLQEVYTALLSLCDKGVRPDIATLLMKLSKDGQESAFWAETLNACVSRVVTTVNYMHYVVHIIDYNYRLKLMEFHSKGLREAANFEIDTETLSESAEKGIEALNSGIAIGCGGEKVIDLIAAEIDCLQKEKEVGISTGFVEVSRFFELEKGNLVVIAGRPSMGKTSFLLSIFNQLLLKGRSSVFFTLEMSPSSIARALLSYHTNIPVKNIKNDRLTEKDFARIFKDGSRIAVPNGVVVGEKMGSTIDQIKTHLRKLKRTENIEVAFIDYLQLVGASNTKAPREQQIAEISRDLKKIAGELGITILATAQLNRGVEGRTDKRPLLSDLRDSGAIEQDADIVCMLYRSSYYGLAMDEEGRDTTNLAEVLVTKNRQGPTGKAILHFSPSLTKFSNLEDV